MKKIIHVIFFLLLCPIVMGFVSSQASSQSQNAQDTQDQTLNLDSGMFGMNGPVSLGLQYSADYGYLLQARFSQAFLKANAVSLGLEYGKNERRIDATLARALTSNQRIKASAEYLTQKMDFDFASGKTDQWVAQPAYGLTYEYLLSKSFVNDFNANVAYSRAIGKTLSNKLYTNSDGTFTNYRHIAGATDEAASVGLDLLPTSTTQVGAKLNYDHVHYQTRYADNDAKDASGLGGTLTLEQLITKRIKLDLLASTRKPYQDYKAGVAYLMKSAPGTQLEFALSGERIIGETGTDNDSQVGLNVNYSFGGNAKSPAATYQLAPKDSMSDLTSFVSEPAVHMAQVLAVRDESSVKQATHAMGNVTRSHILYVAPNKPVMISLSDYFPAATGDTHYTVTGLPTQLSHQNGEITGQFSKKEIGQQYSIHVQPTAAASSSEFAALQSGSLVLLIKVGASDKVPSVNPDFPTHTLEVPNGQSFNWSTLALATKTGPDGMFFDPYSGVMGGTMKFNVDELNNTLKGSGLQVTYTRYANNEVANTFEISGTPTVSDKEYRLSIVATNLYGQSVEPLNIKVVIGDVTDPTFTTQPEAKTYYSGQSVSEKTFAVANAGDGVKFDKDNAQDAVTFVAVGGAKHNITHYGITPHVTLSPSDEVATVSLTGTATNSSDSPQTYYLLAKNKATGQTESNQFAITILPTPTPSFNPNPPFDAHAKVGEAITQPILVTTASPGEGSSFDTSPNITITPTSGSADLSAYNLRLTPPTVEKDGTVRVQIDSVPDTTPIATPATPPTYVVTATNHANGKTTSQPFTVTVGKVGLPTFDPNPPTSQTVLEGHSLTNALLTKTNAGPGETFDTNDLDHAVVIKPVGGKGDMPDQFGFTVNKTPVSGGNTDINVTLTGTAILPTDGATSQTYEIVSTNMDKATGTSKEFTITVTPKQGPTFDPDPPHPVKATEGQPYTLKVTTATAGADGETFLDKDKVVVKEVDSNEPLSKYGLTAAVGKPYDNNTKVDVTISGDHPTLTPATAPQYYVEATNSDTKTTDSGHFTVTVGNEPSQTILDCPTTLNSDGTTMQSSDGEGQSYTFQITDGKISSDFAINSLKNATYQTGNDGKQYLACTYQFDYGTVYSTNKTFISTDQVPASQYDASTAQFTNAPGNIVCTAQGSDLNSQVEYCQLQYQKTS